MSQYKYSPSWLILLFLWFTFSSYSSMAVWISAAGYHMSLDSTYETSSSSGPSSSSSSPSLMSSPLSESSAAPASHCVEPVTFLSTGAVFRSRRCSSVRPDPVDWSGVLTVSDWTATPALFCPSSSADAVAESLEPCALPSAADLSSGSPAENRILLCFDSLTPRNSRTLSSLNSRLLAFASRSSL